MSLKAMNGQSPPPEPAGAVTDSETPSDATSLTDARLEPLSFTDAQSLSEYSHTAAPVLASQQSLLRNVLDASYWAAVATDGEAVVTYLQNHAPGDDSAAIDVLMAKSGELTAKAFYTSSLEAFHAGKAFAARYGFAMAHAAGDDVRAGAILSLAICALVESADEVAADLTAELIETGETHPRIFLAYGIASARLGRLGAAKKAWARAARSARSSPHFRVELHAAQRALIGLQFGIAPMDTVGHRR